MRIIVKVENGKVTGVHSDAKGTAEVLYSDDSSSGADKKEEADILESVPYNILTEDSVISAESVGDCYAVKYRQNGKEIDAVGAIISVSAESVTLDCSENMRSRIIEIPLAGVVSARKMNSQDICDLFAKNISINSNIGKMEVRRISGGYHSGFAIDFRPFGGAKESIRLAAAEIREDTVGGNSLRISSYVSENVDGKDDDGNPYNGKISVNAPIQTVSLSTEEVRNAGRAVGHYLIKRRIDAHYTYYIHATSSGDAFIKSDIIPKEVRRYFKRRGYILSDRLAAITDPYGNVYKKDTVSGEWSPSPLYFETGRYGIKRAITAYCEYDVYDVSLNSAMKEANAQHKSYMDSIGAAIPDVTVRIINDECDDCITYIDDDGHKSKYHINSGEWESMAQNDWIKHYLYTT